MTKRNSAVTEEPTEEQTEAFRNKIRASLVCQLFALFDETDPDTGYPMIEVFCANAAIGNSIAIGFQILSEPAPKPDIEIARA